MIWIRIQIRIRFSNMPGSGSRFSESGSETLIKNGTKVERVEKFAIKHKLSYAYRYRTKCAYVKVQVLCVLT
jgi:hypothetical protein